MTSYMLDTGVLGYICHPRKFQDVRGWFQGLVQRRPPPVIFLPGIADYELRRELLRIHATTGLWKLDHLRRITTYVPLDDDTVQLAAEMWATARLQGTPTA
jgi:predicted nucleic acid-binding protein